MYPLEKLIGLTYYLFHGLRDDSPTKEWWEVKLGFTGRYRGEGATLDEAVENALAEREKDKQ